jgi:hypothetical protein
MTPRISFTPSWQPAPTPIRQEPPTRWRNRRPFGAARPCHAPHRARAICTNSPTVPKRPRQDRATPSGPPVPTVLPGVPLSFCCYGGRPCLDRARLITAAERVAQPAAGDDWQARALGAIARALAATDNLDR